MKKTLLALICTPLFLQAAFAASTNNGCGRFYVQISNLTDTTCILTSLTVNHGNLIFSPPGTIMANDSRVFYMEQTIIGPQVTLSYQCGNENITFSSKQDLCLLEAGSIKGNILDPKPVNINATYIALPGSYLWDKPGNIIWQIKKNK